MSPEVSAALVTGGFGIVLALVAYFAGKVQAEHEIRYSQLYQRQADVIARLYALFYDLEQSVRFLTNPFGSKGEKPTRLERLKEAGDRFREVQRYYQQNSLWLDDDICKKVEGFWDRMYEIWEEFEIIGMALGLAGFEEVDQQEWREVYEEQFGKERPQKGWRELRSRVENEVPQLRQELRTEFRKILGIHRKNTLLWTAGFAGP